VPSASIALSKGAGSTFSGSSASAHCSGTLPQYLGFSMPEGQLLCQIRPTACDISSVATEHAITFSFKGATIGLPVFVSLYSSSAGSYDYTFTITDTAWHQMTIYFPDVTDPSLTPKFSGGASWNQAVASMDAVIFHVFGSPLGPQNFDFYVDDLRFGEPASDNNPVQVASALGSTVSEVNAAYTYELDEQLTWAILRLAAHCGCSVQQIITMRETRSWGQLAIDVGTTWAAILAEVDAAAAGLAPPIVDVARMERSLYNGPLPAVAPRPQRYMPVSQYVPPAPAGGCVQ
jgi:hypothetical protein